MISSNSDSKKAAEQLSADALNTKIRWSFPLRVGFRFAFCYWLLYGLPDSGRVSIFASVPGFEYLSGFIVKFWHKLAPWIAIHIFHLRGPATHYHPTGSGDTTLDYVLNFCFLILAIAATALWSILDRHRENYRTAYAWLDIWVRYTLAFTLFGYGFAKIFPLQFSPPWFDALSETYGQSSPMRILWLFMGTSTPYVVFAGLAEVAGGAFLLFRRTVTLGALISAAVVLNILVLNLCYDVPVKLYSFNLLLMALYLLLPDANALLHFFLLHRAAIPSETTGLPLPHRWQKLLVSAFKILVLGWVLFGNIRGSFLQYRHIHDASTRPVIYGIWDVKSYTIDGQRLPLLVTDAAHWHRLNIQFPRWIAGLHLDGSHFGFPVIYDNVKHTVTFKITGNMQNTLNYSEPEPDHLVLDGSIDGEHVQIDLVRYDDSKFTLTHRGFHWISEYPYNR